MLALTVERETGSARPCRETEKETGGIKDSHCYRSYILSLRECYGVRRAEDSNLGRVLSAILARMGPGCQAGQRLLPLLSHPVGAKGLLLF